MELLAGVVGGLGLFIVGMWFLTENLKKLASRRLRRNAQRWTTNPLAALFWGLLGGGITQSMSALTFIAVSILRSRLITLKGALAMILGGGIGVTGLVMIATFDIKMFALYVVGIAGAMVVTERLSKFRAIAGSFLGGGMVILGLVLVREAAAPLADEPWFRDLMLGTGNSMVLAFFVAALLTFIVQSSGAVSVFGISLAAVDIISVDQAIMIIYGSFIGSSAIMYVLSANLRGRSRQLAMYMVIHNLLVCAVTIPLHYAEGLCCKLGEGAMRDQGASCSPYDSALARRSCSHAMASVRAHGPRPKARSTIRASPTMPPWRANIPAWPLRSARITSKPLIVA